MEKIRVTKEFHFEAAHALWNYDGKCKHIHGHSYILQVTVIGQVISDSKNPKNGMVIDFGELKNIVNKNIIEQYDHALVLNKAAYQETKLKTPEMFDKLVLSDYQPTCENMVIDFKNIINTNLPENVKLIHLRLYETATSYSEWLAADN